jgi:hypothetical protein
VHDDFPRLARWDSVGLDCAFCVHSRPPVTWPDTERALCCGLHRVSLAIELDARGFKNGEWFCADFAGGDRTNQAAAAHLATKSPELRPYVLYEFKAAGDQVAEHPFGDLGACSGSPAA